MKTARAGPGVMPKGDLAVMYPPPVLREERGRGSAASAAGPMNSVRSEILDGVLSPQVNPSWE